MDTVGSRIKSLRLMSKKTQRQLGEYCGVSDVTVGYWEKDLNIPRSDALLKLAKFFNTTEAYILYGIPSKQADRVVTTAQRIPILSYVQAGAFHDYNPNEIYDEDLNYIETTLKVSPTSFALEVVGDSMTNPFGLPSIPEGSMVIVDPNAEIANGKFVVARLKGTNEVTVKKYVIDGPNKFLMPLNPRYSNIPINGNCELIGLVKGVQYEL
ncbi:LexA family transcriptional regulator [Moellerella wisconsensis]|uniref:LexA family protein n=1 Tax=Moellerella wisconsensis TaxID=158849 RepID=UPI001F4E31DD|nr:LexA family transcriptional regulator [Moellerella wisconsensis]UNH28346.1 LexA family transcriptional regulator [Moellerella wisconsensis]WJW81055.1 LexA family transcriptional regulator [Moellerella wisconsensis]